MEAKGLPSRWEGKRPSAYAVVAVTPARAGKRRNLMERTETVPENFNPTWLAEDAPSELGVMSFKSIRSEMASVKISIRDESLGPIPIGSDLGEADFVLKQVGFNGEEWVSKEWKLSGGGLVSVQTRWLYSLEPIPLSARGQNKPLKDQLMEVPSSMTFTPPSPGLLELSGLLSPAATPKGHADKPVDQTKKPAETGEYTVMVHIIECQDMKGRDLNNNVSVDAHTHARAPLARSPRQRHVIATTRRDPTADSPICCRARNLCVRICVRLVCTARRHLLLRAVLRTGAAHGDD